MLISLQNYSPILSQNEGNHMLIPFKVLNSLSKYQYESRADDILLYDVYQGRTVFLHPSSELTRVPQPHKLDSLCRTEWGYCSAVASHRFFPPHIPRCIWVFCWNMQLEANTHLVEHEYKRQIWGVLRGPAQSDWERKIIHRYQASVSMKSLDPVIVAKILTLV